MDISQKKSMKWIIEVRNLWLNVCWVAGINLFNYLTLYLVVSLVSFKKAMKFLSKLIPKAYKKFRRNLQWHVRDTRLKDVWKVLMHCVKVFNNWKISGFSEKIYIQFDKKSWYSGNILNWKKKKNAASDSAAADWFSECHKLNYQPTVRLKILNKRCGTSQKFKKPKAPKTRFLIFSVNSNVAMVSGNFFSILNRVRNLARCFLFFSAFLSVNGRILLRVFMVLYFCTEKYVALMFP